MALTKTAKTTLLAIVSTASNDITVGSSVDVSTWYEAMVRLRMGRATATGFTAAPEFRVEVSPATSPTADEWVTAASFSPALGSSIGSQAVSGTEAAGQTVVTLAAGTNFAANDFVFFHNTTLANSEWKRVLSVSGADLTLQDALVNAQTGATARDQAEEYFMLLDLLGINRIRVVVNGATGTGQAVILAADMGGVTAL